MVFLTVDVKLTSTTMEPVWHKGPQRSQSFVGLIVGLANRGNELVVFEVFVAVVLVELPCAVLFVKARVLLKVNALAENPNSMIGRR